MKQDVCAARCEGDKGTFDSVLNWKYSIQAAEFQWPTHKLLWPLIFRRPSVVPKKRGVAP
jgi:hypothetical protein